MDFYPSRAAESEAIRRAVARVGGCEVRTLRAGRAIGELAGAVGCRDGWGAAWLLLALAEEDARTPGARALAARLRAANPSDGAYARAIHSFVKRSVRFEREIGEVFQSGAYTLRVGFGDCDDHARLVYALAVAGGLPARMAILHHGEHAPPEKRGPAHAVALLCPRDGDGPLWAETTVDAELGEPSNDAAARLGMTSSRSDIAREVVIMSSSELPPVPRGFAERNDAVQVSLDAQALQRLGYLCDDWPATGDAADPMLRSAVLAFQFARGLTPDGLLGDHETRPALAAALRDAGPPVNEGFEYTMGAIGGLGVTAQTKHLSDDFLRAVGDMAARFRAAGSKATAEDFLLVWLAESGIKNIPNGQGAPFGGLNQMGPDERRAAGFVGTFADWLLMPLEQQLPFVERYYRNATGGHFDRMLDAPALYLLNFAPAFAAHAAEPDFVLFRRNPASPAVTAPEPEWKAWRDLHHDDPYAWNRGFDRRRDGTIRVGDLAVALNGAAASRRSYWDEVRARAAAVIGTPPAGGIAAVLVGGVVTLAAAGFAWSRGWL